MCQGMFYGLCTDLYNGIKLIFHSHLQGIEYMHERKIIHRDLKTKNLLLFNNFRTLKLCDFGTVREMASNKTTDIGTAKYMAPEV